MGWYFTHRSRNELIQELIKPQETEHARAETFSHALRGNVLWSVVRVTAKEPGVMNLAAGETCCYIRCDLLQGSSSGWGHKPLDECMHPYYYTCPLGYLQMAPVKCPEWRERVRAYHGELSATRRPARVSGATGHA